jgi:hypothetical protein
VTQIGTPPAPRNQKQLRQFLGICNFHHRFIINYIQYVSLLLPLLEGKRWKCNHNMQTAFEQLRQRFAMIIQLTHPSENQPLAIHTDASSYAIAAVLSQTDEDQVSQTVSTASRVLMTTKRRYAVCEQELLSIIYALQ